jgi:hypothetical protein
MSAGRPLVIGGGARAATLGGKDGAWVALRSLDPDSMAPALRRRVAEAWARDALFEHASVASFSRFSLHLLAVAAPPDLVDDAHSAARDEIQHARLCFALASAYAGEPLGPGPLPLEGDILGALDLPSIAAATVREGCVGETLASLEAATALEHATVPAAREALTVITEDEARHAELAWRFVRWALDVGDDAVRAAVKAAFDEALTAPPPAPAADDPLDADLLAHGRLSDSRRQAVMREGLTEVVRPAVDALLAR